ncbi:MAG TPA: DUF1015 domain-containing protein [Actinomycetota bacterium]|nr:DUF1015 domain-containing protein [Actinomycetota bacterium]
MPRISPFVGWFFDPARVGPLERVTTPPYDTITGPARDRFAAASPYNVVRLDLAEASAREAAGEEAYRRAGTLLDRWRREGVLVPDDRPSLYAYEMRFLRGGPARRVRGLICLVELEPWGRGVIPHERTLPGPVEDRLRLLRATRANLSCVYGTIPGPNPPLAAFLDRAGAGPPLLELTDEEGVRHRLWPRRADGVEDAEVSEALGREPLLIADGHHRYATAVRFRDEMRAARGAGPWDHVMALVVDASTEDPPVLPYHRLLARPPVPGRGDRVADLRRLLAGLSDEDLTYGIVAREDGAVVHRLGRLQGRPPTVCALHEQVLARVPPDLLGYTQDAVRAEDAVRRGDAAAAFLLPPTTAARIREVVDRGERLPEKSTFFWPKPRTGLVIRMLEPG